ncbi:MAG: ABC transporter ATP-binding protein [Cytophagales bacterium]|nr:MAG: ABC transporter ATP-binding protein [Cytophagales bacterium]
MLSINNMSFYFGSRPLYDEVSLHVKPKNKIGLIGANGTGKSTLLRIISGEYKPDKGEISKSGDCTIGFLNQDLLSYESDDSILHVAMQAFEEAMALQKQIDDLLHEMEINYKDEQVEKLTKLQERFDALDGYSLQAKAEAILEGLGFSTSDLSRPLRTFSGGWRMRVMLAKMLLSKPALLMLDEPTNHLDLPSIQWIEEYLNKYEGAVIVVSHDRQFLDNVAKTIVEVTSQDLVVYSGNYSFYLEEKELRKEIQNSAFENQQSQIRQTERFIERFKAKASKSRQVQSRVKALDKIERIEEVVDETAKVHFKFNFKIQPGRNILYLKNVSKSYGDLHILKNTSATIERGDKIALIGANGKGKSTLLRILAGEEPITGERAEGHNVNMSFFAQHQLESLNLEGNLLDELKSLGSDKTETELRGVLGCFLFSNDDVFKKIKVLSGGEKSRVALAKTLISESNFLLLDEPTNHLDMQSVNILTQALDQYEGTYVVISHDRHFISKVANKIWFIENMELKEYPGTYDEFNVWMQSRTVESNVPFKKTTSTPVAPKVNTNSAPKAKPAFEIKNIQQQISLLEQKINQLEIEKRGLEEEMTSKEIFSNPTLLAEKTQQLQRIDETLTKEQNEWENLMTSIEEIQAKS